MADKDKTAGSSSLGGARKSGVLSDISQANYQRLCQKVQEIWRIPDVLDAFPVNIRPDSLGLTALTNLRTIAGKKTLAEARALFVRECQGEHGVVSTVGWSHTDKICKAIKDDPTLAATPSSTVAGSAKKASCIAFATESTPDAVPADNSKANMEMRYKKVQERAPKEVPPLIDPRTDPRAAPFATPTSTSSHKTSTPRFDEHARGTTNPTGFLEPKISPRKKGRSIEEVGGTRVKQAGVNRENRSVQGSVEDQEKAETNKDPSAQEKATNPLTLLPRSVAKNRKAADTQNSAGEVPPNQTSATQQDSTTIVVQPPARIIQKKSKSSEPQKTTSKELTNIAGTHSTLGGTARKRTISDSREALGEDSSETQVKEGQNAPTKDCGDFNKNTLTTSCSALPLLFNSLILEAQYRSNAQGLSDEPEHIALIGIDHIYKKDTSLVATKDLRAHHLSYDKFIASLGRYALFDKGDFELGWVYESEVMALPKQYSIISDELTFHNAVSVLQNSTLRNQQHAKLVLYIWSPKPSSPISQFFHHAADKKVTAVPASARVDEGIDLSRESPRTKKARLSVRTETAAQKRSRLDHDIDEQLALNALRIAEINEKSDRLEAHTCSKTHSTMSDEDVMPTMSLLGSQPSTPIGKKRSLCGSVKNGDNISAKDSADPSVREVIESQLTELPGYIRGFLKIPSLGRVKKEDPQHKLLVRANLVLATAARHVEADLAHLFKESGK